MTFAPSWPRCGRRSAPPMPLRLTDDQLEILRRAAEPLPPEDRDKFLRAVADRLRDCAELGNGMVYRIARDAQGELL